MTSYLDDLAQRRWWPGCVVSASTPLLHPWSMYTYWYPLLWLFQVEPHLGRAIQAASPVARCAVSASTPLPRMRPR